MHLTEALGLPLNVRRVPITEAGCAGGILAMHCASDFVRAHPGESALVVSAELCSLAFRAKDGDAGALVASLLFADGAGAAVVEGHAVVADGTVVADGAAVAGGGYEIVDQASALIPNTQDQLGFRLTDDGFSVILARDLVNVLPEPSLHAVNELLCRNGVRVRDVSDWLLHPGGARIISSIEERLELRPEQTQHTWESMRVNGNTSSAAIFDVLSRGLGERTSGEWGLLVGFGPGLTIELMLLRSC